MNYLMNRTFWKNFVKLKCKEIKDACIQTGKFLLFMVGILCLIALYFGFTWVVGMTIVNFTGGSQHYSNEDCLVIGFLITILSYFVILFCMVIIGIKRWIQKNIKDAIEITERDNKL